MSIIRIQWTDTCAFPGCLDIIPNIRYPVFVMLARSFAPQLLADIPVFRAADLKASTGGGSWRLENLEGTLAEVSEETACGAVSFVTEIILEAQGRNEPVAWVAGVSSIWYPPDLADRGVDLGSLVVIRAGGADESLTAAEWLVRSGALGLMIVDAEGEWKASDASLGRILKLAERSQCAVIFLTRKRPHEPSLGSRISLRGCVSRSGSEPFRIAMTTLKDKRSNSSSRQGRQYHGPSGMH
jgi:recombination protein RecA